ncbi:Vms1/Ankzf1 family peptidyl-tRNA hydrolase [Haloarcula nitratireducens]|uniref:Peptide chain release factor 1 n=1 Tax=Haloarcula nitratireducens TaxID=2487749 RepID=A0AAW4P656_9EURY|nr:Vms1/Ankzf1 family peptidyl-tRNA hydrolase [Halomicroarcula nitratireducens]MBX0293445.1 peptide chain release factor 1 [Halomicroarcula nitratireducens]
MTESTHADDLRNRIEAVETASADTDRLLSVAVPATEPLGETLEDIEEDHAEASYLDTDETTQTHVREALDEIKRILNDYDETPTNGLVVYAGVVDGDLRTYVFDDPPESVTESVYERSNEFDASPLDATVAEAADAGTHGLLVVARESAVFGRYDAESVELVDEIESDVPSKQSATGRSEESFQDRSEERAGEFFDAVGDAAQRVFLPEADVAGETPDPDIDRLVVGGSEVMAEQFHDGDHLHERLEERVVGPFEVSYASEQGLRELVDAAENAEALDVTDARDTVERFFGELDDGDEAVYGPDDTEEALEEGAVETLLVSDSLDPAEAQELSKRASETGADTVTVPTGYDRGERFDDGFEGVGALLRYPVA